MSCSTPFAREPKYVSFLANGSLILSDPDDEPLVQLALESAAMRIISHNLRHLQPATALGVQILKPTEFLTSLRQKR